MESTRFPYKFYGKPLTLTDSNGKTWETSIKDLTAYSNPAPSGGTNIRIGLNDKPNNIDIKPDGTIIINGLGASNQMQAKVEGESAAMIDTIRSIIAKRQDNTINEYGIKKNRKRIKITESQRSLLKSKGLLKEDWEEDVYGQDYDHEDPGGYKPNKSNHNVMSSDMLYLGSDIKIVSDVEFVFTTQKGKQSIDLGKIQLPNNTEYEFTPWEYDEGEIYFDSDVLYNQIKGNLPPNTDGYFKSFLDNNESMKILKDKDSGFFNWKDVPEENDFDYRSLN